MKISRLCVYFSGSEFIIANLRQASSNGRLIPVVPIFHKCMSLLEMLTVCNVQGTREILVIMSPELSRGFIRNVSQQSADHVVIGSSMSLLSHNALPF